MVIAVVDAASRLIVMDFMPARQGVPIASLRLSSLA
jgi:hypothetical protein